MVIVFEGFNEMHETYISLELQSNILHDHDRRREQARRDYDNLLDWKKYIKDIPDHFQVLDKGKLKRI